VLGQLFEQTLQRSRAEPVTGPHDRATGHLATRGGRQHEIEVIDHLGNRAIAKHPHPERQPDALFGGQRASPDRRRARRAQGVVDPRRVDRSGRAQPRGRLRRAPRAD
jgi:hypothetical protein